jgi:3-oxoacyl-[acyl-carrier protein] reductase
MPFLRPMALLAVLVLLTFATSGAMSTLQGKRILVTGGGRGIGRAIAHICANEGAKVAICSRNKSELEETLASAPPKSIDFYVTDVKEEGPVDEMVKSVVEKWGGIDVLINNAGRNQSEKGPTHELDHTDFKDLLSLNIISVHLVTSSVLKHSMLKNKAGRIINVSSKAGKIGIPGMSFYVASKFALEGYSATLSEELKDKNIIVNTISPGMVNTSSFPKPEGRKGVRTAESVRDGLILLLDTEKTGHYVHVDELDQVKEKKLDETLALKPINEEMFTI